MIWSAHSSDRRLEKAIFILLCTLETGRTYIVAACARALRARDLLQVGSFRPVFLNLALYMCKCPGNCNAAAGEATRLPYTHKQTDMRNFNQ